MNKKIIAVAVSCLLSLSTAVHADSISMSFTGLWSFGTNTGSVNFNGDSNSFRTAFSGTAILDTDSGTGSATIDPFIFDIWPVTFDEMSLQRIGDGFGNTGTLVAAEMSWDWNGNVDVPTTAVFDAAGLFANIPAPGSTVTIGSGCVGCAVSTTPDVPGGGAFGQEVIGAVPIAMTNYNTAGITLGSLFPLVDDGIAGSPMTTPPFPGQNFDFDFTSITATNVAPVPVPAAFWMFGSGFLVLMGIARRRGRD